MDDLDAIFIYLVLMIAVACFGFGIAWFCDRLDDIFRDDGRMW
jgi:hypothetical protein